MKNLNIFEVQGKIKFLGVGSRKKLDIGGLPKKGTWTVRTFNGGLGKKVMVVFDGRELYPNAYCEKRNLVLIFHLKTQKKKEAQEKVTEAHCRFYLRIIVL